MHLIHDENGNLCAHGHEHDHDHTHEHTHEHHEHGGCAEGCCGCGGHTHDHTHEHAHGPAADGDKLTALLDYMLKHNEHHAAELDQVAAKLRDAGKDAAAEQIKKAVDEYQKGNLYLNLALSLVK